MISSRPRDIQNWFLFPVSIFDNRREMKFASEGCAGIGRWHQNQGHYKRFFVGQLNAGFCNHMYIADNVATNHVSQPWSNSVASAFSSREPMAFIAARSQPRQAQSSRCSPAPSPMPAAFAWQGRRAPLAVVIRDGTGIGQGPTRTRQFQRNHHYA